MQGNTEQELRIGQLKLIVIIMIILFVTFLGYSIAWVVNYNNQHDEDGKVRAQVVAHEYDNGISKDVVCYVVDNIEYRISTEKESHSRIGKKLIVFYDKENPIDMVVADDRRFILPVLTGLFGVACGGLIVVYFIIKKSIRIKKMKMIKN